MRIEETAECEQYEANEQHNEEKNNIQWDYSQQLTKEELERVAHFLEKKQ